MKRLLLPLLILVLAVVTAGCGSDGEAAETSAPESASSAPTTSPTPSQSSEDTSTEPSPEPEAPEGTVIEVTIEGDDVSPSGERVEVGVGEPVTFRFTSDRPGEIHVHSTPEQELAYDAGTTEVTLTIDKPGVVEVEDHDAHLVLVQLQVS